jgi:hypothetical protein
MQYSPVNMNEALYRGDDQRSLWMNAICASRKRLSLAFLRDEKLMVKPRMSSAAALSSTKGIEVSGGARHAHARQEGTRRAAALVRDDDPL